MVHQSEKRTENLFSNALRHGVQRRAAAAPGGAWRTRDLSSAVCCRSTSDRIGVRFGQARHGMRNGGGISYSPTYLPVLCSVLS